MWFSKRLYLTGRKFLNLSWKQSSTYKQKYGFNHARNLATLPEHQLITLPALSPTMTEGSIVRWLVKEGEELTAGDSLCEIETDKATVDFELQDDGYLAKILVPAGDTSLPCGTVIGVSVEDS